MTSFALEPIYGSLLLAIGVAVATVAIIVMVTPPTTDPRQRRWLIALRLLAAVMLLLAVLRPALIQTDNRPVDAALVVAVDTSRSMTLPDGDGGQRWTTQVQAWQQLAAGLEQLDAALSIRLIAYDSTARPIAATDRMALDQQNPEGESTDLSAAALATIQAAQGQPIAGVVLMGDGTQTAPITGTGAQRVVETLRSLAVPLWTVPIGPAGGQSNARDVAIDALPESYQLFAGNEVNIDFQLLARGLSGIDLPVRLSWIDAEGQTSEIAVRRVTSTRSSDTIAVTVAVTAPPPGTYRLKVEAEPQSGELITTNNRQLSFVDVREGGGRILYLEGAPRSEQTFLRRALRRFPDLDLTYRWIPSDTSSSWPVSLGEWFEPGRFDIYVIGDLDAAALGGAQLGKLAEAVAAGSGLVTLGGYQTYGGGGYASSPLAAAIPVDMDPGRRRRVGQPPDPVNEIPGPLIVQLAKTDAITDLGGDDPAQFWQQLPPLLGANRWRGPRVAPGVEVLLQSTDGAPLMVIGQYGKGRTAALAFDSTWRWWRGGQSEAHRRFWRQLVLWLLAREESGGDKILIELDARRFAVDNPPQFRAHVESVSDTATAPQLTAEVIDESGQATPLSVSVVGRSDAAGGGSTAAAIEGQLKQLEPGIYRLRVAAAQSESPLEPAELAFQVVDESRELAQPMADPVYLRQLADLTADAGGGAFAPDQIDDLLQRIAERRQRAETPIVQKYRLGDGPRTGWLVFGLFAGALSAEWFLRRRWGLA